MNDATITLDEILSELNAGAAPPDYRTLQEWMIAWGCTKARANAILKRVQIEGRLATKRVPRETMSGHSQAVPGYKILPAQRKGR